MRRMLVVIVLVLALISLAIGCTSTSEQLTAPAPPTQPVPKPAPTQPQVLKPTPPFASPTKTVLNISKAPRVGEIVDVTYSIDVLGEIKPIIKLWVEFERYDPALYYPLGSNFDRYKHAQFLAEKFDPSDPSDVYRRDAAAERPETLIPHERILIEGDLAWEGSPLQPGDKILLNGKIRFPEEGEWVIYARVQSEGEIPNYFTEQRLTINKESGSFGWPKDYSKGGQWSRPKESAPIAVTLKPGRAPLLGEPLELPMVIQADRDVPEGEVYLRFFRQEGSIRNKEADYRVEGDLSWSGGLKKDFPVELYGKVIFYEEGDWGIEAFSKIPESQGGANKQSLWLHIGKESSRYGWTGSEGPKSPPPQGEPTPTPKPEPRPAPTAN